MKERLPQRIYDVRTYHAHVVGLNDEYVAVLCVTYSLDPVGQSNAALLGRIGGSEFPPLPIPQDRELTFREELRITGAASCVFDAGVARENEEAFLSARMAEAFGPVIKEIQIIPQGRDR